MMEEKLIYVAKDDRMSGDRILKGDTLIIDSSISTGKTLNEIYLVEVNGEKSLGRIEHSGDMYRVYASDPSCPDSFYKNVTIIGKVFSNVIKF